MTKSQVNFKCKSQSRSMSPPNRAYPWFHPEQSDQWHEDLKKRAYEHVRERQKLSKAWGKVSACEDRNAKKEQELEEWEEDLKNREQESQDLREEKEIELQRREHLLADREAAAKAWYKQVESVETQVLHQLRILRRKRRENGEDPTSSVMNNHDHNDAATATNSAGVQSHGHNHS